MYFYNGKEIHFIKNLKDQWYANIKMIIFGIIYGFLSEDYKQPFH